MSDGRMLKKQISMSRRLAELKTDSARLLYTWIIPHLDIKGRLSANPFVLKGTVVPRIETMTAETIEEYLLDMARVGVIVLYSVDGDEYLELRKFGDHQYLRADREAPSVIPDPAEPTPDELRSDSGATPGGVRVKIREVKIREDKRKGESAPSSTPPSPRPVKASKNVPCPEGVDPGIYEEFLADCKAKDKPFTARVLEKTISEAAAAGLSLNDALRWAVEKGYARFESEWYWNAKNGGKAAPAADGCRKGAEPGKYDKVGVTV